MDLFLFTNFFPYKRSEPFLVNEFEFTKKNAASISVFTVYGKSSDAITGKDILLFPPLLASTADKNQLFPKGVFNFAPFHHHLREFFSKKIFLSPSKTYNFFVSLLLVRMALSSKGMKLLLEKIEAAEEPVLYFYWGDNLCWIIPYLIPKIKKRKPRIVIRFHGTDLYEALKSNYAPLREKVFAHADLLCPVSENGATYLQRKYPQFAGKIKLARLGVNDHGMNPFHAGEAFQVISVSNVIPLKRVDLIFHALQASRRKITWHHFGSGPLSGMLEELVKTKREGLEIVLHGQVDNTTLMNFFRNNPLHLFLNVSTTEGLPVSIMEAFSFGIPAIATNVGGTGELVNENTGRLVDVSIKAEELAVVVDSLLGLPVEEMLRLRKNARKAFEEKVNAATNYAAFYNLLKSGD